jgi:capsular exopolysaccharide synthesis family protein
MNIECEGSTLKFSKLMHALFKYKWINLLILLTFWILGYIYYKSQVPVYSVSASIEIKNAQLANRDFFGNVTGETAGLETEIDIIRSNYLIVKTLKDMGNSVRYYHDNGKLSTPELYQTAPFKVENFIVYNPELYGRKIMIRDLGNGKFSLEVKKPLKSRLLSFLNDKQIFDGLQNVYSFNKIYATKDLAFKIIKLKPFKQQNYSFSVGKLASELGDVKRNLKVSAASLNSNILQLTYKDFNKQKAKDFLNKLLDNYLVYSVKNQTMTDRKRLEFVNAQIANINQELAQSENSLEGFKVQNNISNIEAQIADTITKVGQVEDRLQEERVNYQSIVMLDNELKKGNYSVITSVEEHYPVLAALEQNLEELERERERLLENFTYRHPNVMAVTKSIEKLKSSITKIVQGIKNQVLERKRTLEKDLAHYQDMLKKFPTKEKELGRHERLFKVNDDVYNYLLQKQSELSIEKVSHTSNKNILDYAEIAKNLNLKLPIILLFSTLLGLFAIVLHTIIRTKFDVKIKTPEDITDSTDIPLYGIIPFAENKETYNRAYVLEDATSTASEAFRAIRTNLDYIVAPHGSKVVLVTSNIPNEGKTVVAANLAAVIGMSEKRVIILSLDLRRPEMHHKFGLSNKVGMSDVLAGKVPLKEAIWEHEIYPNLNIITSGRIPPNPSELLSSNSMKNVIDALKKEYDYIILDTPPINYVADAVTLFKLADINLFVVKSDFTEIKHINEFNKLVEKLHLENVGIILNSVKKKYNNLEQFDYKYLYYEPL